MKKKRLLAAWLIVLMMLSSLTTAMAATVGTPGTKEKTITVTLDPNGGYFEDGEEHGTASEATPGNGGVGTASSGEAQEPASGSEVKSKEIKLRTDNLNEDDGNMYAILGDDYEVPLHTEDDYEFYGWYYKDVTVVNENTPIYSSVVLKARWIREDSVEIDDEVAGIFGDTMGDAIVASGLKSNQKLHVGLLPKTEQKTPDEIEGIMRGGGFRMLEGSALIQLDLSLSQGNVGADGIVVTMTVPDGLDTDKPIYAVHILKNGEPEIILGEYEDGRSRVTFKFNSLSPVILVNGEKMVSLKVENVPNGAVLMYTEEEVELEGEYADFSKYIRTFVPIGETVEVPKGTQFIIEAMPYGSYDDEADEGYECDKIVAETSHGDRNLNDYDHKFEIMEDTVIRGSFKLFEEDDTPSGDENQDRDRTEIKLWIEPEETIPEDGMFEGTVEAWLYDYSTKKYVEAEGAVLSVNHYVDWGNAELFTFDSNTHILKSNKKLQLGRYRIPFTVEYNGKVYSESPEVRNRSNSVVVTVGTEAYYNMGIIKRSGEFIDLDFFGTDLGVRYFVYKSGISYDALINLTDEIMVKEDITEPRMFNYDFVGWSDAKGNILSSSDRVKIEDRAFGEGAYLYPLFKNADGKTYGPTMKTDSNTNNNNTTSSSRRSSSKTNSYNSNTIHGNWIQAADGRWQFQDFQGNILKSRWGVKDGKTYYFDDQGYMKTGWFTNGVSWFYFVETKGSEEGKMMTGWFFDPTYNRWFYFDQNGVMVVGWQYINGKFYYFNPVSDGTKGAMFADTTADGYQLGSDGARIN